jgi:hypothetical protein
MPFLLNRLITRYSAIFHTILLFNLLNMCPDVDGQHTHTKPKPGKGQQPAIGNGKQKPSKQAEKWFEKFSILALNSQVTGLYVSEPTSVTPPKGGRCSRCPHKVVSCVMSHAAPHQQDEAGAAGGWMHGA